jgi:hypothetical protein
MGFLDNSGDIILDAVLTDTGRKRLAQGNGKFKVAKFALGDDEIDYGLYNKEDSNGTPYYDVNILQTPVLEAFTNNMSSMNSRLMSYAQNDLLFLPIIAIRNAGDSALYSGLSSYVILVDQETTDALTTENNSLQPGLLNGYRPDLGTNLVQTDQGLDTTREPPDAVINPLLLETQYFVQIDNQLGFLAPSHGGNNNPGSEAFNPSSIDDDGIATYIFTLNDPNAKVVEKLPPGAASEIAGPRGTRTHLKIAASLSLRTSTDLFNQLGTNGTSNIVSGDKTLTADSYKFIDSTLRVSGVSTGYTLDIPIRFVKKNS